VNTRSKKWSVAYALSLSRRRVLSHWFRGSLLQILQGRISVGSTLSEGLQLFLVGCSSRGAIQRYQISTLCYSILGQPILKSLVASILHKPRKSDEKGHTSAAANGGDTKMGRIQERKAGRYYRILEDGNVLNQPVSSRRTTMFASCFSLQLSIVNERTKLH
jgi:hypothetical protein